MTLSRRGILGFIIASPAIIRVATLMPIKAALAEATLAEMLEDVVLGPSFMISGLDQFGRVVSERIQIRNGFGATKQIYRAFYGVEFFRTAEVI